MASDTDKLLVRFRDRDSRAGVTRKTLRALSSTLGIDETAVIHLALAEYADQVLPRYERDGGLLTPTQLEEARSLVAQEREPTSTLFGTTARRRAKPRPA